MYKKMQYLVIGFLIGGLFLEIAAFFIGNVSHISWLLPIIAPAYHRANVGYNKLNSDKLLESHDKGFTEISNLFIEIASKQNPPEVLKDISVIRFIRKGAVLGFSTESAREKIPVEIQLTNGQTVKWDMHEIKPLLDNLKSENIFKFAVGIFILGVSIQIIGIILEIKKIQTNI